MLGRAFIEQESQPANSHVAIISNGLWQSRFAADPKIIGREITLQGETYTVVGVLAPGFQFSIMGVANIWTPIALDDKARADRNNSFFAGLGRLKPGVTEQKAVAEAAAISARFAKEYPQTDTDIVIHARSLQERVGVPAFSPTRSWSDRA